MNACGYVLSTMTRVGGWCGSCAGQWVGGDLAPGAMVPPVKRLRAEYGVAETTARKAVAVLRDEGLVETVTGWGTLVRKDPPRQP